MNQLQRLEEEAVFLLRETAALFRRPVMLYSIGKDSTVLAHLAAKAFWPAKPPFPLLHIDTTWKFREMIAFRDRFAAALGFDLRVHVNRDGIARDVTPFFEIFVDAPLDICERRDPKGLYAKARRGEIRNFTGLDSAYEQPSAPDLHLDTGRYGADELADRILRLLVEQGIAT